jgi:hypothetical protein
VTTTASAQTHRQRAEATAVANVIARLKSQFPEMSGDEIEAAVTGKHREFDEVAVRDFVPILVERSARENLRGATPRHRA